MALLLTAFSALPWSVGSQGRAGVRLATPDASAGLSNIISNSNRYVNWALAGVNRGITHRTTVCNTLVSSSTAEQINRAIAACAEGQVVMLGSGTFSLSSALSYGTKNNVTVRGQSDGSTILNFTGTSSCNGKAALVCMSSDWLELEEDTPQQNANWTSGYAKDSSTLRVSGTTNLQVGDIVAADQLDDTADNGAVFVCATTSCTDEGGNSYGRTNRGQQQWFVVTAITANQVTVAPPIAMTNWRATQDPEVNWTGSRPRVGLGLEDVTINAANASGAHCISLFGVRDSWIKGVKTSTCGRNHVYLYGTVRISIRDSYFYGNQSGGASTTYGIEDAGTSWDLIVNNIFEKITTPISHNSSNVGSVVAYNWMINMQYSGNPQGANPAYMQASILYHNVGLSHILHEGNHTGKIWHDDIHGPAYFGTEFRNLIQGDVWNSPAKNDNTSVIDLQTYARYFNAIGNVLGRTGYYTTYGPTGANGGGAQWIFSLGTSPDGTRLDGDPAIPTDPVVKSSLMRWCNYDTVSATVRSNATEVPVVDAHFPVTVPADGCSLPASLYYAIKPSWFGDVPWPPIGPDVTGGDVSGYGGRAYKIPARRCWEDTMRGVLGTDSTRAFAAAACYGPSSGRL